MPRHFDFFEKVYEDVPAVGTKRGHLHDLQGPDMTEEMAFIKARHYSLDTVFVDR